MDETKNKNSMFGTSLQIALLIYSFFGYLLPKLFSYSLLVVVLVCSVLYVSCLRKRLMLHRAVFFLTVLYLGYAALYLAPVVLKLHNFAGSNSATLMAVVILIGVLVQYIVPSYSTIFKIIVVFSLVHVFFTILSFLFPSFFMNYVVPLLPNQVGEQIHLFLIQNLYAGITTQTGRNSVYIAFGFVVLVGNFLSNRQFRSIRHWVLLIIFFFAILLTGKRGTLLAVVFSCFVVVAVYSRKSLKKIFGSLMVAAIVVAILYSVFLIFVPSTSVVLNRFISIDGTDITSGRLSLFSDAFEMFLQKPMFGWGFSYFNQIYEISTHNMYLQLLADTGIIGLLLFTSIFAIGVSMSISIIRKTNETDKGKLERLYTSLAGQIFFLAYGLTDSGIMNDFILLCYFIFASFSVHYAVTCSGYCKINSPCIVEKKTIKELGTF